MGRPSRVPDAGGAGRRVKAQENGQSVVDAPLFFANVELRAAEDGDARAVIAAILEAAQTFDKDRAGVFFSNVSDDAAHKGRMMVRDVPSDSSSQ